MKTTLHIKAGLKWLSLTLLYMLIAFLASAQTVKEEWARRYAGEGPSSSEFQASVIDDQGNVYITGNSNSTILTVKFSPDGEVLWFHEAANFTGTARAIVLDQSGGVYVVGNGSHIITYKLSATNGNILWESPYTGSVEAFDIAVDKAGGVYITGSIERELPKKNYLTVKYNASDGGQVWVAEYNGPVNEQDIAHAITTDTNGGVYVTGSSVERIQPADRAMPAIPEQWVVTVKYNAANGAQLWTAKEAGQGDSKSIGYDIAHDGMGGVYITGVRFNAFITAKYDAATGQRIWRSTVDGVASDQPNYLVLDGNGDVYVLSTLFVIVGGNIESTVLTTNKYSKTDGELLWESQYQAEPGRFISAQSIAAGSSDDIYVTGIDRGNNFVTIRYHAEDGEADWISRHNVASDNFVRRSSVITDGKGNLYMVTSNYFPFTLTQNLLVIKYDPVNGQEIWVRNYGSKTAAHDRAQKVIVDDTGNSYVTGFSIVQGSLTQVITIKYSPDGDQVWVANLEPELPGDAQTDIAYADGSVFVTATLSGRSFLAKYDAATGDEIWVKRHETEESRFVRLVALRMGLQGDVYVTGTVQLNDASISDWDYLTARYNAATGNKLWESTFDFDNDNDQASAIAVDASGGVYVTGFSWGPGTTIRYATLRYDAATGAQKWVARYNGSSIGYSRASAIAVDNKGGVYVTGTVQLSENFPTDWDYGTVRYDAETGTQTWASHYHVPGFESHATAIAVDNAGGVYVTGWSNKMEFDLSSSDYATVKYEAATGNQSWVTRFDGPAKLEDHASAIVVDNAGGVYVTGWSQVSENNFDYATIRYNTANGQQVWLIRYNGEANSADLANDLAVSSEGNVFVTGTSLNQNGNFDYLTVKYSQDGEAPCNIPVEVSLYLPPVAKRVGWQVRTTADFGSYTLTEDTGIRWTWGDGTPPTISYTAFGTPRITGEHTYQQAGIYQIGLDFTQSCLKPTNINYEQWMPIFDPEAGLVTGAGQATALGQRLGFNFSLGYGHPYETIPRGHTHFLVHSLGMFRSRSLEWLVVSGDKAAWKGEGVIDGKGRYGFIASVTDAGNPGPDDAGDRLRVKVWDMDRDNRVVYDSFAGGGEILDMDNQGPSIDRGNIIIHRPGNAHMAAKANSKAQVAEAGSQLTAYPNTFSERTTISFSLKQEQHYTLEIYDSKGRLVKQLAQGRAEASTTYEHDLNGKGLNEGLYIARLVTDTGQQSIKVLLKR